MLHQPPSGGCVLKRIKQLLYNIVRIQPPSGGCVLKHKIDEKVLDYYNQPPSGGCVLKHNVIDELDTPTRPAAFRRLCVETSNKLMCYPLCEPAAFRRLCVETCCG